MITIKPSDSFHAGTEAIAFKRRLQNIIKDMSKTGMGVCLDLSDVLYMDTCTFRIVFDMLPSIEKVIPPSQNHIVDTYNTWLDGKKGLSK